MQKSALSGMSVDAAQDVLEVDQRVEPCEALLDLRAATSSKPDHAAGRAPAWPGEKASKKARTFSSTLAVRSML